jgi:hypothetical protein
LFAVTILKLLAVTDGCRTHITTGEHVAPSIPSVSDTSDTQSQLILAEDQGVEPCQPFKGLYGLAIRCITVLPALRNSWCPRWDSNPQKS